MSLSKALGALVRSLRDLNVSFAVVGGVAASVRGEVRFTRDIDVAVAVEDDEAAESILFALKRFGYEIVATVEQEATHRLATARLRGPGGIVCDLVFATCGIENEIVADAEALQIFPDVVVPTATAEALLAMKVLSSTSKRPNDLQDIESILRHGPTIDLQRVEALLEVIQKRGYARGQDLAEKWRRLRDARMTNDE